MQQFTQNICNFAVMRRKGIQIVSIIFMITLMLLWSKTGYAGSQPHTFSVWKTFDSEKLLNTSRHYANTPSMSDSALLCASMLTERYSKQLSEDEKKIIVRGYTVKAYVYLFRYYDLSRAYESLLRASAICQEIHYELSTLYMDYGHLFSSIGEQGGGNDALRKALYYIKKAFHTALAEKNYNTLNTAFGNAISIAWELNQPHSLDKEWNIFRKLKNNDKPEFTKFNLLYYEAYQQIQKGNLTAAIALFDKQSKMMPDDDSHVRYTAVGLFNMAKIQQQMKEYDAALINLHKAEALATRYGMKDVSIQIYYEIWQVVRLMGDGQVAEKYHSKYLSAKEEMLNYQQVAGLKELSFMDNLRKQNDRIAEERTEKMTIQIAASILLLIVVLVSGFAIILARKNRQLSDSNEALYNKVQEMISTVDEMPVEDKNIKYKDSRLNEAEKTAIYMKACEVMDNSNEILEMDFSIRRLAELAGTNYRNMSQVINEKAHCNFNSFLNKYRIRQACKMMNDAQKYGNYTIEGYSTSVGFKSRNTFVTSFKRITGLTPSEYLRINRSKNSDRKQ